MTLTGNNGPREGTTRRRDPYQYDIDCLNDAVSGPGKRQLQGFARYQLSGVLLSEFGFTNDDDISQLSVGMTKSGTSWQFSAALQKDECMAWTKYLSGDFTQCLDSAAVGIFPTDAVYREAEDYDLVLFSDHLDYPTAHGVTSKHRVRFRRSNTEFSTYSSYLLARCVSMTGFMNCLQTSYVYTSEGLAVAWDDWNSRVVNVWVEQTRLDDGADHEVMVAVGTITTNVLPEPDTLGVKSAVTPAVACKGGAANGYDCVVAYVDLDAANYNQVSVRRFWNHGGSLKYNIQKDSLTTTIPSAFTGSRIALWYSFGKFWLAVRSATPGQPTALFSSTNSVTWTVVNYDIGDTIVGPSAISYRTDNANGLVYAPPPLTWRTQYPGGEGRNAPIKNLPLQVNLWACSGSGRWPSV